MCIRDSRRRNRNNTNFNFYDTMRESETLGKVMCDIGDMIRKYQNQSDPEMKELHSYWWGEMAKLIKKKKKVQKQEQRDLKEITDYFA